MKLQRLYNLCRQQSNSIRCLSNCRKHSTSAKPSSRETFLERVSAGPGLQEFFNVKPKLNSPLQSVPQQEEELIPYLPLESYQGQGRKVHFEIYGCQMNTNDTEVVWSIMKANGYTKSQDIKDADVVMIVTCAVREGAETKIWNRLNHLKALKEKRSIGKKRSFANHSTGLHGGETETEIIGKRKMCRCGSWSRQL